MRKILALLATAGLIISAFGCSDNSGSESNNTSNKTTKDTNAVEQKENPEKSVVTLKLHDIVMVDMLAPDYPLTSTPTLGVFFAKNKDNLSPELYKALENVWFVTDKPSRYGYYEIGETIMMKIDTLNSEEFPQPPDGSLDLITVTDDSGNEIHYVLDTLEWGKVESACERIYKPDQVTEEVKVAVLDGINSVFLENNFLSKNEVIDSFSKGNVFSGKYSKSNLVVKALEIEKIYLADGTNYNDNFKNTENFLCAVTKLEITDTENDVVYIGYLPIYVINPKIDDKFIVNGEVIFETNKLENQTYIGDKIFFEKISFNEIDMFSKTAFKSIDEIPEPYEIKNYDVYEIN